MKKLLNSFETLIKGVITAITFLALPVLVGYILYNFICFDFMRVIAGLATVYISLYLNKELQ